MDGRTQPFIGFDLDVLNWGSSTARLGILNVLEEWDSSRRYSVEEWLNGMLTGGNCSVDTRTAVTCQVERRYAVLRKEDVDAGMGWIL